MRRAARIDNTAKRSKYRAQPCVIDGIRFASKAEARHYGVLKIREKVGEIHGLNLQPRFFLDVDGESIGEYRADFEFCTCPRRNECVPWSKWWRVQDVKGFMTPLAKWKIKHVEAQYGIKVEIVK